VGWFRVRVDGTGRGARGVCDQEGVVLVWQAVRAAVRGWWGMGAEFKGERDIYLCE